jgi:Na+/proline symporter
MEKEMYEKAINAYNFHVKRYNTWMNQYAIFVGVVFIAYYNVLSLEKPDSVLSLVILAVGLIASICWLGSFHGSYAWLKSWIKILHLKEGQYLESQNAPDKLRTYSVVMEDSVKDTGFFTQKITLLFIWVVIFAWFVVLTTEIYKFFDNSDYPCYCKWLCSIAVTIIIAAICFITIKLLRKPLLSDINYMYRINNKNKTEEPYKTVK